MAWNRRRSGGWILLGIAAVHIGLSACGSGDKKEEQAGAPTAPAGAAAPTKEPAISGTITLDPPLQGKVAKEPLLMIMASKSPEPNKPAVVVKRVAAATFPHQYKLTAEDITLVGSTFEGKLYVTARIDPAGMVGAPRPGTLEGTYAGNPVAVGSTQVDILINRAY